MTESIEGITTSALSLALNAALMRQQAISTNIANINTENYTPQRVDFSSYFREARAELQDHGQLDAAQIDQLSKQEPAITRVHDAHGRPAQVRLDAEVAQMAQNAVQYQALLKGLSHQFALLSLAVNEGKR